MKTKMYGGSDDLIEIEGRVEDEIGCYKTAEKGVKFEASDGTTGKITYNGEWKIEITNQGNQFLEVIESVGDDESHTEPDAKGLTSYSDILILDDEIEWVKIGGKKYKS